LRIGRGTVKDYDLWLADVQGLGYKVHTSVVKIIDMERFDLLNGCHSLDSLAKE
jgi:hypothetical protein